MVEKRTSLDIEQLTNADQLFEFAEHLGYGDLHFKFDRKTGLRAIVAIHNTNLGPALGGCRCIEYPSFAAAMVDAMRLARGMSYKAAIAGIPHGGGKAVIMKPPVIKDRKAFFAAFGRFVNELGGRYITAKDSGSLVEDMDVIASETDYVTSTSAQDALGGDPSPYTALGVSNSVITAVNHKLKRDMKGLKVAVQGLGHVGYHVAKNLYEEGAEIIACDTNHKALQRAKDELNATIVEPDDIFSVECDVFSPNALGAIINDETISQIKAGIIAGGANNQLADIRHGEVLRQKDILYAPDYVINSAGLIYASAQYAQLDDDGIAERIDGISKTLVDIFNRAEQEQKPTNQVARDIARERLEQPKE